MPMTSEQMEELRAAHEKVIETIKALQLAERVLGAPDKSWMGMVGVRVSLPTYVALDEDRAKIESDLTALFQENIPLFAQTLLRVRREAVEALVVPARMPPSAPVEAPPDA